MNFSPFSCPIFLGHPEARGRCSQGERVLYGRDLCRSGGTGKAEAAKLPGAGIGPKQCPRKCVAEKAVCTRLIENPAEQKHLDSRSGKSRLGKRPSGKSTQRLTSAYYPDTVPNGGVENAGNGPQHVANGGPNTGIYKGRPAETKYCQKTLVHREG